MPDNSLPLFRDGITTLKSLRKSLKAQRRALVQIVADTEIEMCEVHTSLPSSSLRWLVTCMPSSSTVRRRLRTLRP